MTKRLISRFALSLAIALAVLMGTASIAAAAPALKFSTITPDHVRPGGGFPMYVNIRNVGDDPLRDTLDGLLTIRTVFPDGIVPLTWDNASFTMPDPQCQLTGQVTECTIDVTGIEVGVEMRLQVSTTVDPGASGVLSPGEITVSGGGTTDSFTQPLVVAAEPLDVFAIRAFDISMNPTVTGLSPARAGSAPVELATHFASLAEARELFGETGFGRFIIAPPENFRDVRVHVPVGLVGNPTATAARCTLPQLASPTVGAGSIVIPIGVPACPPASQIGVAEVNVGDVVGVYNLVPPPGYPAAFGFFYNSIVVTLLARLRPADNGIDIVTEKVVSSVPLPQFEVTLWGNPTDRKFDHVRSVCLLGAVGYNAQMGDCALRTRSDVPFLRMPTSCPGTPLLWGIEMDTYQNVGRWVTRETTTPAIEGCQHNPFDPGFAFVPSTSAPHAPSGVDASVTLDQDWSVNGIAPADLRRASVTLPEGLTINPSSADGLAACTDADLRMRQEGPAQCPSASRLGTVTLRTPLLDHEVSGSIWLRTQNSDDPLSGELFRIAVEIRSDQDGLAIKLPGAIQANPVRDNSKSGQLTTVFDDLPQLPFSSMDLHFKTGPRAPLSTPKTCGTYNTHAEFTSWSGRTVVLDTPFTINQGCEPRGFAPKLSGGLQNPIAATQSPFALRLTRQDTDQEFGSLDVSTPQGLAAVLKGVPVGSQLGTVTAGAGAGSNPLYIETGKAFLGGPYRGEPLSLLFSVPAIAGPFNLGTVEVRAAVHIDPVTAQITVRSDPLPTILAGVPLNVRDIRVNMNRPNFVVSPTSCDPMSVDALVTSTQGTTANPSQRFQLAECSRLGFKPKLTFALRGPTRRTAHPALTAILKPRRGDANISKVSVALPKSEFLDQAHLNNICTRAQFASSTCPAGAIYGHATVSTPLFDEPLTGPVYLRSSRNLLPDLVPDLRGPDNLPIRIEAAGRIDEVNGGIRNTFDFVPDAPFTKFVLRLKGGNKGLLQNSRNICRQPFRATVKMDAHNGKIHDFRPVLKAECGGKSKKKGKRG